MRTRKPYSRKKKPNPIAKNLNKFNKPSIVPNKREEERQKGMVAELAAYYKGIPNDSD